MGSHEAKLCSQVCYWCHWGECMESSSSAGRFSGMLGTWPLRGKIVTPSCFNWFLLSSCRPFIAPSNSFTYPCLGLGISIAHLQSQLLSNRVWMWLGQRSWQGVQSPLSTLSEAGLFLKCKVLGSTNGDLPKGENGLCLPELNFTPALKLLWGLNEIPWWNPVGQLMVHRRCSKHGSCLTVRCSVGDESSVPPASVTSHWVQMAGSLFSRT